MKKILFILLIVLMFPTIVLAESFTIKTHIDLKIGSFEENEFKFVLKDQKGNIIQTKTNDKKGDVIFDPIEYDQSNINYLENTNTSETETFELRLYTIEEVIGKNTNYKTSRKIWVKVVLFGDSDAKVYYLEDPDIDALLASIPKYKSHPYHATEEELKGVAYSRQDLATGEVVLFRDESGKYTTGTSEDGKYYYQADIENTGYFFSTNKSSIKSIKMEGAVRPTKCEGLFFDMSNLESIDVSKLDTSLCTNFNYMFEYTPKLKTIDITTFDITNVKSMNNMFYNVYNWSTGEGSALETIKIPSDWDLSNIQYDGSDPTTGETYHGVYSMFDNNPNLKNIDMSIFKNVNFIKSIYSLFNRTGITVADFSSFNIDTTGSEIYEILECFIDNNYDLFYLNLSGIHNTLTDPVDIDLDPVSTNLRVVDVGERFYTTDSAFVPYSWDKYNQYTYNIDHGVFDNGLSSNYKYKSYVPTGRHLYIVDESVTLTKELKNKVSKSESLEIGSKLDLSKYESSSEKITWENISSDIVKLEDNKLIGLKVGTITLKGYSDNNEYTITINVIKVKNPKTGVTNLIGMTIISIMLIVLFINNKKKITTFKNL